MESLFGLSVIKNTEVPLFLKAIMDSSHEENLETIMDDIILIDKLLIIQRSQMLLKRKNFKRLIDKLFNEHLGIQQNNQWSIADTRFTIGNPNLVEIE